MSAARRHEIALPERLPLVPLRDIVVFPFVTVSLSVSRVRSLKALDAASLTGQLLVLVAQREPEVEDPAPDDLHSLGTVAVIVRRVPLPDDRVRVLVQGLSRARVDAVTDDGDHLTGRVAHVEALEPEPSTEREALMKSVTANVQRLVALGKTIPSEAILIAQNLSDPGRLADLAASHADLKVADAQELLETADPMARLRRVNEHLSHEIELRFMQREITNQAREEMGRSQREYFLRQQLKAIQRELGEGGGVEEEVAQIRARAKRRRLSREAEQEMARSLAKLERLHPDAAEQASVRAHLDWLVDLPWGIRTRDRLDLAAAARLLHRDHAGLASVKQRLLEHLAVRKLRKGRERARGPILCFVGPPGVGKTSLGRSIAEALGRRFVRLPLGGLRDEAEIRGHRRTYVGALPGRILQGLRQCGASNPVFMLDEVDKIGADARGDPAAALLEVLDPEQNAAFQDHYLGVPFDLSDVMFIATANLLDTIHPAFRDRLEVIGIPGYTEEEKVEIAARHLVPRLLREHGLDGSGIAIEPDAVRRLVRRYTREAGLRGLERQLGALCRKVALAVASGQAPRTVVDAPALAELLGPEPFQEGELLAEDAIGVAAGLGLTAAGGELLFVETKVMKGRGTLILTGQLGDVMKESAQAALSLARAHARELHIAPEVLDASDIHVHLPSGATPKDGPSAGVTLLVSMVSALSGQAVDRTVAMTGEITLRGELLPVGGVKEKVLAARRAGARLVLLPARNRSDLAEVSAEARAGLDVRLVATVGEVMPLALASRRP